MRILNILLACLLAWGLAGAAQAADGDLATDGHKGGPGWIERTINVCHDVVAANDPDTCTVLDLYEHGGIPDRIVFRIAENDACSAAYTVNIDTYQTTGTDVHDVATLNATTTRAVARGPDVDRYIAIDSATLTDCTDLTIEATLRWEKRYPGFTVNP